MMKMVNEINQKILRFLRDSNDYTSGEILARELGISRVAIWKHIHSLKEDGYTIETMPKGYRLLSSPDLLLPYEFPGREENIHHLRELSSTMDVAKELAKGGANKGTIVVAESQSQGRGRLSRSWLSPKGGIYFTVILRPQISPIYAPRINLMASIAVARAIRKLFGLKAELKWPNDVLIAGKKVCGILAEMEAEVDTTNFVNLGIGINANSPLSQFEKTATSLNKELGREISRKELLNSILKELDKQQTLLTKEALLEQWRSLSSTLNKDVKILSPGEVIVGKALDIDTSGALIIKGEDGCIRNAVAGDCTHLIKEHSY